MISADLIDFTCKESQIMRNNSAQQKSSNPHLKKKRVHVSEESTYIRRTPHEQKQKSRQLTLNPFTRSERQYLSISNL